MSAEGQSIINGLQALRNQVMGIKSDLARIEAKIPSEERIVSRIISAIQSYIDNLASTLQSAIAEGFSTIRTSINAIKDIILQLIRSLFGSGDSIDYSRISEIVNSAHQTTRNNIAQSISTAHQATREIIVNILSPKLEAGFANLESLIKSLKLTVDYDRIINGLGDLIISSHRATREIIANSINSAHQSTREIIVNILSPKLEAGFANLESLIKSLKLTVDYDRIAGIVNTAINGLGDLIISSHQTTRQVITDILDRIPGTIINVLSLKLNAISAKLDSLINSLKSSVDYDKIKGIVDGAHNFTRGIILAALGGLGAAVAAAVAALVPAFTVVVETAAATIANGVRQAAAQLAAQLEAIIRRLLQQQTRDQKNTLIEYVSVNVQVLDTCEKNDEGNYHPTFKTQSVKAIKGTENQTILEFARIAQIEGNQCQSQQTEEDTEFTDLTVPVFDRCENSEPVFGYRTVKVSNKNSGLEYLKFERLALIEAQECSGTNAVVALPERYELSPDGHIPQMVYLFREVKENGTLGNKFYPITVPHPANTIFSNASPLPTYQKGSWEGILTLKDNSKAFVNAFSLEEAERMLDAIKTNIQSDFLVNSFQKAGRRKGQALLEINVRVLEMHYYPNGTAGNRPEWVKRF